MFLNSTLDLRRGRSRIRHLLMPSMCSIRLVRRTLQMLLNSTMVTFSPCFHLFNAFRSYLSNSNKSVNIATLGIMTCGEIQKGTDARKFFPDECGEIRTVTLATSDPCQCKLHSGGACPDAGFSDNKNCNLCGGNKRIGDPHMVVKSGILDGLECIDAVQFSKYGTFSEVCSTASALIQKWCSCVEPGETVKKCIPQEDTSFPCDPNDPTDTCCEGQCRFRSNFQKYVCTNRAAQVPPPSISFPSKSPQTPPIKVPSPVVGAPSSVPTSVGVSRVSRTPQAPHAAPTKVPTPLIWQPIPMSTRAPVPTKIGVSGGPAPAPPSNEGPTKVPMPFKWQPISHSARAPVPTTRTAVSGARGALYQSVVDGDDIGAPKKVRGRKDSKGSM